ncbi:transmembrane protein 267 [Topomyia yanbarensis]|uniref:transmembrane protein 267 n=1 Tax=Topomyia yanbarensis TaxID=2498891 RepID=UPI00273C6182|nr:transmembrane protein 267 [Topomyia yanbarensis]XP_058835385.1 transmembrane protein 267 [Topomyia yanbarensis]
MSPTILLLAKHIVLLLVCITGDKLSLVVQKPHILKAAIDNVTHALIGLIVTEIVVRNFHDQVGRNEKYALIGTGFVLSSLIDLDHFIEAKSFSLHDATNLSERPFLHNSSIFLGLLVSMIGTIATQAKFNASLWITVNFIAFFTHQLRDAIRRGFWFRAPYLNYSTAPVIYWVYLALTQLCPHAIIQLLDMQRSRSTSLGEYKTKYKALEVV